MEDKLKNRKCIDLLQTARALFWKHGFRRVSVEEICKKAGVSKMTFYRFFPNKLELAKKVFDHVVDEAVQVFKNIMAEDTSSSEKIKKLIRLKLDGTNDISREFLADFYNCPELGLASYIEEKTKNTWAVLMEDFRKAQKKGWFRKDIKPEFYFYMAQKLGEIYNDKQLSALYHNPQEFIMEIVNFFMYGLSPHD
ncbi:MAG: TetR/AcrR family transcriptional regulator [Bacteroidales bacterium]|nr:TetR/AcrR family transcriptional regulator [Bacteroidales bacterium]MBN2762895.1 TetR/AcrR family transcriptional regulator [Bacteroidales bacterium]